MCQYIKHQTPLGFTAMSYGTCGKQTLNKTSKLLQPSLYVLSINLVYFVLR